MFGLNGGEFLLLIVLALVILGPERLPGYAAKLGQAVRNLRDMAEGAKSQIKDEMGPAFDDVDWRQLDPRQYDPRRIVREALSTPSTRSVPEAPDLESGGDPQVAVEADDATLPSGRPRAGGPRPALRDRSLPTPFDSDAT